MRAGPTALFCFYYTQTQQGDVYGKKSINRAINVLFIFLYVVAVEKELYELQCVLILSFKLLPSKEVSSTEITVGVMGGGTNLRDAICSSIQSLVQNKVPDDPEKPFSCNL